ncbi:MAG: hypothetical protein GY757_29115, partial [bacterium]|nr:hypothetical protein [bacterium]
MISCKGGKAVYNDEGHVIAILPKGQDAFLDQSELTKAWKILEGTDKEKEALLLLDATKHATLTGGKPGKIKITAKKDDFEVFTSNHPASEDVVVINPATPKFIKAGGVIGYPGKYVTDDLVHLELFTGDIGFLENSENDASGGKDILIKKEAQFKKKKDLHKPIKYTESSTEDAIIPDNASREELGSGKTTKKYKITHLPLYIHHRDGSNVRSTSPTQYNSAAGNYNFNNNEIIATIRPQAGDNQPIAVVKP